MAIVMDACWPDECWACRQKSWDFRHWCQAIALHRFSQVGVRLAIEYLQLVATLARARARLAWQRSAV